MVVTGVTTRKFVFSHDAVGMACIHNIPVDVTKATLDKLVRTVMRTPISDRAEITLEYGINCVAICYEWETEIFLP